MSPHKKSLDSTTWNRSIHPLTTKRQPIQPSKRWTQLFNISLKNCFLIANFKIRSAPNSNANTSIGSWSRGLSDQRMRWGIVYSWRRLTKLPLEAHNCHLQPVLMFAKLRHLRPSYCSALTEAQNSLVTYLRGFPSGQYRNSQMMAEAQGFSPVCNGGFHSHSSSWCDSNFEMAGYSGWMDSQEQRWLSALLEWRLSKSGVRPPYHFNEPSDD